MQTANWQHTILEDIWGNMSLMSDKRYAYMTRVLVIGGINRVGRISNNISNRNTLYANNSKDMLGNIGYRRIFGNSPEQFSWMMQHNKYQLYDFLSQRQKLSDLST